MRKYSNAAQQSYTEEEEMEFLRIQQQIGVCSSDQNSKEQLNGNSEPKQAHSLVQRMSSRLVIDERSSTIDENAREGDLELSENGSADGHDSEEEEESFDDSDENFIDRNRPITSDGFRGPFVADSTVASTVASSLVSQQSTTPSVNYVRRSTVSGHLAGMTR